MSKLSIFVGSSSEGLRVAREIQSQLADVGEVERWDEGVFALGSGTLEALVQALNRFDFAVFVLTADNLTISRGAQQHSARDNVLIELGLFIGRIGRERTFLVCCKDDKIKIPSDLAGITFATYSKPSDDSKLTSAVGPTCTRIRNAIEAQGKAAELQKLKDEVKQQELDIQAIRVALRGIMTKFEIDYLRRLAKAEPWNVRYDPDTYYRLKRLDDMGFVLPTEIDGQRRLIRIQELFGDENIPVEERKWFNLKDYAEITEAGKEYVKLYDAATKAS
jgi:hypothetical protein